MAPQASPDGTADAGHGAGWSPIPVFGGGQVQQAVQAIQGGAAQGLSGRPQGSPDPIQIDVDLEAEADYEILPSMGE